MVLKVPLSWDDAMEIILESVAEVDDPYHAFVDSIKNSETLRKYDRRLYDFLKLVPLSLYREYLEKPPEDDSKEILSKCFVRLPEKDLFPNCKHPKKMRDKAADGQWYYMNYNSNLESLST